MKPRSWLLVGLFLLVTVVPSFAGWQALSIPPQPTNVVAIVEVPPYLYIGTSGQVLRTADFGATWESSAFASPSPNIYALAWDQARNRIVAGGNVYLMKGDLQGRVFFTSGSPFTWSSEDAPDSAIVQTLLASADYLFAAGEGTPTNIGTNLWKLTASSVIEGQIPDLTLVYSLAETPTGTLYAAGINAILHVGEVWKSTDRGTSWTMVLRTSSYLTALAAMDDAVFATGTGGYVVRSIDRGATWQPVGAWSASTDFHALLAGRDGCVYLGGCTTTGNSVWASCDAGDHWAAAGVLAGSYCADSLAQTASGTLYAGTDSDLYEFTGCLIDGVSYDAGQANPANLCQVCDPASHLHAWSDAPSTTLCRAHAGACDLDAYCASGTCPANPFQPNTVQCRAAQGVCDLPASCTGSSTDCPANPWKPAGTVCRPKTGACDVAETCTGSSKDCPADAFAPNGAACDDGLFCDGGDTCMSGSCSVHAGTPCSSSQTCDETQDLCVAKPRCGIVGGTEASWAGMLLLLAIVLLRRASNPRS